MFKLLGNCVRYGCLLITSLVAAGCAQTSTIIVSLNEFSPGPAYLTRELYLHKAAENQYDFTPYLLMRSIVRGGTEGGVPQPGPMKYLETWPVGKRIVIKEVRQFKKAGFLWRSLLGEAAFESGDSKLVITFEYHMGLVGGDSPSPPFSKVRNL